MKMLVIMQMMMMMMMMIAVMMIFETIEGHLRPVQGRSRAERRGNKTIVANTKRGDNY